MEYKNAPSWPYRAPTEEEVKPVEHVKRTNRKPTKPHNQSKNKAARKARKLNRK